MKALGQESGWYGRDPGEAGVTDVAGEYRRDAQRDRQGPDLVSLIGHSKALRFYSKIRGNH